MPQNTFNLGDVVQLKSGGPTMTVTSIDGEKISTIWFNATTQKFSTEDDFRQESLKLTLASPPNVFVDPPVIPNIIPGSNLPPLVSTPPITMGTTLNAATVLPGTVVSSPQPDM